MFENRSDRRLTCRDAMLIKNEPYLVLIHCKIIKVDRRQVCRPHLTMVGNDRWRRTDQDDAQLAIGPREKHLKILYQGGRRLGRKIVTYHDHLAQLVKLSRDLIKRQAVR